MDSAFNDFDDHGSGKSFIRCHEFKFILPFQGIHGYCSCCCWAERRFSFSFSISNEFGFLIAAEARQMFCIELFLRKFEFVDSTETNVGDIQISTSKDGLSETKKFLGEFGIQIDFHSAILLLFWLIWISDRGGCVEYEQSKANRLLTNTANLWKKVPSRHNRENPVCTK